MRLVKISLIAIAAFLLVYGLFFEKHYVITSSDGEVTTVSGLEYIAGCAVDRYFRTTIPSKHARLADGRTVDKSQPPVYTKPETIENAEKDKAVAEKSSPTDTGIKPKAAPVQAEDDCPT